MQQYLKQVLAVIVQLMTISSSYWRMPSHHGVNLLRGHSEEHCVSSVTVRFPRARQYNGVKGQRVLWYI